MREQTTVNTDDIVNLVPLENVEHLEEVADNED